MNTHVYYIAFEQTDREVASYSTQAAKSHSFVGDKPNSDHNCITQ